MNNFERLMLEWATKGEGEEQVRIMMEGMVEDLFEDNETINDIDPEWVGENVFDIFMCHYDHEDGGLYPFITEMANQIDDYDLGKAVIRYYEEHVK